MKKIINIYFLFLLGIITLQACNKENLNTLSVDKTNIDFSGNGGNASFVITTDAETWNIDNPSEDWVKLSKTEGTKDAGLITVSVSSKSMQARAAILTISAGTAKPITVVVSQLASLSLYDLTSNTNSIKFKQAGNEMSFTLNSDASSWTVSSDVDWISFDKTAGAETYATVKASALENPNIANRTAKISIKAEFATTVIINVTQTGKLYPSYNTNPLEADMTGMTNTATQIAANMKIGWNLGNTLEAIGGETAWGNPVTSQALIDLVKTSGFNAVRIPCSWNAGHLSNSATAEINTAWLARVKEVVQYCVNNNMYAVLNIHWDGGWLENNCTPEKQEENNAKQKAFWEQIATYFRDFDEHLVFAGANEPNVDDATQMAVLNSYSQTFINAVRSTGGKNAYRTLIVQGPSTDIEKTNNLMIMPTDNVANRMMVEVHYYTPWNFCGMEQDETWGKMFYYWGNGYHSTTDTQRNATWGEESTVQQHLGFMKTKFIDKGIPVLLGEFAATRRSALMGDALTNHLNSRAYYHKYLVQQAKSMGIIPFYWDNGGTGNHASGIFNRPALTVSDQKTLDALMEGAGK